MPPISFGGLASPTHRLSLKDIAPNMVPPLSTQRNTVRKQNSTSDDVTERRRGSFTNRALARLASHKTFEDSIPTPQDEISKADLRHLMESWWCNGLVAVGAGVEVALFAVLVERGDGGLEDLSDPLRAIQLGVASAFLVELGLRLYSFGLSYFNGWGQVLDSFVVIATFSVAFLSPYAGLVCLGRLARLKNCCSELKKGGTHCFSSRQRPSITKPKASYETPAMQLLNLLMRTLESSCNIFSVEEKQELRKLIDLLAHNQIYVDESLQRLNSAYWKEYGVTQNRRVSSVNGVEGSILAQKTAASAPPSERRPSTPGGGGISPTGGGRTSLMIQRPLEGEDEAVFTWLATKVDEWDFDAFHLDDLSVGHPLLSLCNYLFDEHRYNFFNQFNLSKRHFTAFIMQIEQGYGSGTGPGVANIYHNRRHAADVTQAVHYFMRVCKLGESLTDIETISLLLASIVHDFKHPGRSNAFLVKTGHELSITYNDVSVLENYHVSEAFKVLKTERCNFLHDVEPSLVRCIRDTVIPLVMATDLKFHFDLLGEFNTHLADRQAEINDEGKVRMYISAMKICIKSADISHPTRAMYLHLKWTKSVIEEFFLQGDEEKKRGIEVSPLCDRANTGIANSQKGFINFLVKPLFKSWVSFLDHTPAAQICMTSLEVNEAMWNEKEKKRDDTLEMLVPEPSISLPERKSSTTSLANGVQGEGGGAGGIVVDIHASEEVQSSRQQAIDALEGGLQEHSGIETS